MKLELIAWMGLCASTFWLVPPRWRARVLIVSGVVPLAYLSWMSALALAAVAAWTEGCHRSKRTVPWPIVLAPAVALLLVHKAILTDSHAAGGLLFVGASYYCLRMIHASVTRPRARRPVDTDEWFAYAFFAPVLLVGPLARLDPFVADLRRARFERQRVALALERIIVGHAKWLVGAGFVVGSILIPFGARLSNVYPGLGAHFGNLTYGLDLYLRFAGFTDIALGFAALLGFSVIENFDRPFVAATIVDFWQRWHRSLGEWCRDHIYVPLVATGQRPAIAVLTAMTVLALWHELSLRYLLWGFYHAAGIGVYRRWQALGQRRGAQGGLLPAPLAHLLTMGFVISGFVLTRSDTTAELVTNLCLMIGVAP